MSFAPPLIIAVVAYLAAFVIALRDPSARFVAQSAANFVWMTMLMVAWYRGRHPLQLESKPETTS